METTEKILESHRRCVKQQFAAFQKIGMQFVVASSTDRKLISAVLVIAPSVALSAPFEQRGYTGSTGTGFLFLVIFALIWFRLFFAFVFFAKDTLSPGLKMGRGQLFRENWLRLTLPALGLLGSPFLAVCILKWWYS